MENFEKCGEIFCWLKVIFFSLSPSRLTYWKTTKFNGLHFSTDFFSNWIFETSFTAFFLRFFFLSKNKVKNLFWARKNFLTRRNVDRVSWIRTQLNLVKLDYGGSVFSLSQSLIPLKGCSLQKWSKMIWKYRRTSLYASYRDWKISIAYISKTAVYFAWWFNDFSYKKTKND
jgi:hypothetical protein